MKGQKTGGRVKGTSNKTTALLKDAILEAAAIAGKEKGLTGYLTTQAISNPGPFMALLGKVLPTQVTGDPLNPIEMIQRIERVIVGGDTTDSDAEEVPTAH